MLIIHNPYTQDPEISAAFKDITTNPANMSKYASNPKIMALVAKLSGKFGAKKPTTDQSKPEQKPFSVPTEPDID